MLALAVKGDTSAAARATADGILKVFIFYAFLMLVAFHTAANGRMRTDTFVNALLLGIVATTILQPFVSGTSFEAITQTPFRSKFVYLAVMGFGVTYVRLSLRRSADLKRFPFDAFLMVVFFCLTAIGFGRAAWMAALLVFALVSRWTGRKSFWIVSSLVLVLALTVPLIGERLLPGSSARVADVTLARATTGRSVLWGELWKRGADLIPNFVFPRPGADARPGRFGVFVGRLSSEKGVHVLLDALRIAKDPPFRVVGDGPLAAVLRSEAATIGLKNTEFLGRMPHDQVDEVLRDARFLVLPSLSDETSSLAGLEALALGRLLLVTSRGALPELVREGTGLVCTPGDPRGMAKSIERLMEDDAFCLEAGTRGLSISRQKFGPEMHLALLEAAYRTCIEQAATAPLR